MIFKKLYIQNFLSFGTQQVVDLKNQGLVAVLGQNNTAASACSNGSGKSTLLCESLVWVLWGKTLRRYQPDEVINRTINKDCEIQLDLEDDNGTEWSVRRTRGKSKTKKPNDVYLLTNGQQIQAGINTDTQVLIDNLIGMDFKTFTQSVLLSAINQPFSQLTDAHQKEILEDILNVSVISQARSIATKRLQEKQLQLASINTELQSIDSNIAVTERTLQEIVKRKDEHEILLQQRKQELLLQKSQCESNIGVSEQGESVDSLLQELKSFDDKSNILQQKYNDLTNKVMVVVKWANEKKSVLMQQKAGLESKRAVHVSECAKFNSLAGKSCPTCHRLMDVPSVDSVVDVLSKDINDINIELESIVENVHKVETLEHNKIHILETDKQLIKNENDNTQAQHRIISDKLQQRTATIQLVAQLKQQIVSINHSIVELENSVNPYTQIVESTDANLHSLNDSKQSVTSKTTTLNREISHLLFWDNGFSNQGLKSFIIEAAIPFLNERVQKYTDILTGGDITIEFSAQKQLKSGKHVEELQVKAVNQHGADVYRGNSAGECRRIDLAIGWALGDLAAQRAKKSIKFRVLDEPFDSVDEVGEDLIVKFLHTVLPEYESIFCISHSDHLRNQFPKVLTIVKENGFSTVSGPS